MITYVQGKTGSGTAVVEVDCTFTSNNSAHNMLQVFVGIKTTSEAFTLTVEDTLGNVYKVKNFLANIGITEHATMISFFVKNCRPGANTVKAKSTLAGDMVVCCHEYSPGSGNRFQDYEALTGSSSNGVGTLSADSIVGSAPDLLCLMAGYAEPQTHAMVSVTMRGSFSGGAATSRLTASHATDGVLGSYDQIYTTGTGITSGCDMVFDSSVAPNANRLDVLLYKAFAAVAIDDQMDWPTVLPAGGESPTAVVVTLSHPMPSAAIYYTTDGTTPTTGSTLYTGPITISTTETLKCIAHDPSGFFTDSIVISNLYDIYTGTCANPAFVIDGNDTTFAELDANGSTGDIVAVKAYTGPAAITGAPGSLKVFYEVTQNDLVAATQTLPAWKIVGTVSGVDTIMASGVKGAGVVAPTTATLAVPAGTHVDTLKAIAFAICQVPGSTGGVKIKIYGAWLQVT